MRYSPVTFTYNMTVCVNMHSAVRGANCTESGLRSLIPVCLYISGASVGDCVRR